MRIISWNVNGLRAVERKGALDWLINNSPDIFCFQETKAHPDQLSPTVRNMQGYQSFFAYPTVKKGYSGVAIYTKKVPDKVEYGIGMEGYEDEGRSIELHFGKLVFFSVYFPNGGGGPDRLKYKLEFYDAFLSHIDKLKKKGKDIIFCGDVNTAHEEIDLARPKENEKNTGFLPEEREWIDEVVRHGYIDTFRHLHPNVKDAYTYWDMKTASRERNVGWRIDYFFVSNSLEKKLKKAIILKDIFGSDHCPIEIEIDL